MNSITLLRRALRVARAFPEGPLRTKFRYNARELVEYYGTRVGGEEMLRRFGADVVEPVAVMLAHVHAPVVFQSLSGTSKDAEQLEQ